MEIKVYGKSPKITKQELKKATRFFGSKLLRKDTYNQIDLEIILTKPEDGFDGFCEWSVTNYRPKDFLITINNKKCKKTILKILAHEMVHLRQFTTNQLFQYYYNDERMRWKKDIMSLDDVKYNDRPWEIEANELEEVLYNEYIELIVNGI